MKVQLFENPVLYGLIMGGMFGALFYVGDGFANLLGATAAGVVFGVLMTFVMRWVSQPPESSR